VHKTFGLTFLEPSDHFLFIDFFKSKGFPWHRRTVGQSFGSHPVFSAWIFCLYCLAETIDFRTSITARLAPFSFSPLSLLAIRKEPILLPGLAIYRSLPVNVSFDGLLLPYGRRHEYRRVEADILFRRPFAHRERPGRPAGASIPLPSCDAFLHPW